MRLYIFILTMHKLCWILHRQEWVENPVNLAENLCLVEHLILFCQQLIVKDSRGDFESFEFENEYKNILDLDICF